MNSFHLKSKFLQHTVLGVILLSQTTLSFASDTYCDNTCGTFIDPKTKATLNLTGNGTWSSTDDAWCSANVTNSAAASPSPTASSNANYATEIERCQFHSSQILQYCVAYEGAIQSQTLELPLLLLDVAGTALCATACAGFDADPMVVACRADSVAASSMDIADAIFITGSPTSKAITVMMGAAGFAASGLAVVEAGSIKQFANGGHDGTKNSCITAGVFAAATGVRLFDMNSISKTEKSSCDNVKNLFSSATTVGTASPSPTAVNANSGSTGSVSTGLIGASQMAGNSSASLASAAACANNGVSGCAFSSGTQAAATEGQVLSTAGMGIAAAQKLASSDLSSLANGLNSGASAGSLANSLGSLGDIGTKIADIANAAQADAASKAPAAGSAFSSGAAVPKAAAKTESGFGNFNLDSGVSSNAKAELGFDRSPASVGESDIWHKDFKGSIFQIVTSKINAHKDQVKTSEWLTPLNRALMGLPKQKSEGSAK